MRYLSLFVVLFIFSCTKDRFSTRESYLESLIIDVYCLYEKSNYIYPAAVEVPLWISNSSTSDSALVVVSVGYLAQKLQTNMDVFHDSVDIPMCAQKMSEGFLIVDSLTFLEIRDECKVEKCSKVDSIYHSGGIKSLFQHYVNNNFFIFNFSSFKEMNYLTYLFSQYDIFLSSGFACEDGFYYYVHPPYRDDMKQLLDSVIYEKSKKSFDSLDRVSVN